MHTVWEMNERKSGNGWAGDEKSLQEIANENWNFTSQFVDGKIIQESVTLWSLGLNWKRSSDDDTWCGTSHELTRKASDVIGSVIYVD